jgi:transcriptional regulator NrdR family protein
LGKVRKRAGNLEEFEREKIETAVQRAGATEQTARETAQAVETRFREKLQREAAIPTSEIRTSVLDELRRSNVTVAQAFEEYKAPNTER